MATERGLGHRMVDGEVVARHSGQLVQVLLRIFLLLVLVATSHDDRSVVVVYFLILRLGVLGHSWGTPQGLIVLRGR